MRNHHFEYPPEIKKKEEEAEIFDFALFNSAHLENSNLVQQKESIDNCSDLTREFVSKEDSKGRAEVFTRMTSMTPSEYWDDKDAMDRCRYELDKEQGLLLGDDAFYEWVEV
jgi:hypothetical protein